MKTLKIKKGTKIECNNVIMVVTGENEKYFLGYHEYKGQNVGELLISKSMFSNHHYMNEIKIIN